MYSNEFYLLKRATWIDVFDLCNRRHPVLSCMSRVSFSSVALRIEFDNTTHSDIISTGRMGTSSELSPWDELPGRAVGDGDHNRDSTRAVSHVAHH